MADDSFPLVSCIMLVGRTQVADIVAAIQCFKAQTYPYRELIIVNNARTQFEAASLNLKAERDVFMLDLPTLMSAGSARNHGIAAANGQILAQFDADYYHAPLRLEAQIATMVKNEAHAAVLAETISYSFISGRASYQRNQKNAILSTMVCIRPAKIDYPNVEKGEELGFLNNLTQNNMRIISIPRPELCCKYRLTAHERKYAAINVNLSDEHFSVVQEIVKDRCPH